MNNPEWSEGAKNGLWQKGHTLRYVPQQVSYIKAESGGEERVDRRPGMRNWRECIVQAASSLTHN